MAKQLQKHSLQNFFLVGLINGLLPCGMVYMAIAAALSTTNVIGGSLLMSMFGIGTMPAMIGMSYAGIFISLATRNKIKKAIPVIMFIMAVLLILRGLNLGIPYISPVMAATPKDAIQCH